MSLRNFYGCTLEPFAAQAGTPVFLFSERALLENFAKLTSAFATIDPPPKYYYSAKTNFEPAVLQTLRRAGAAIEIAAGYELRLALKAGFLPGEICFDGPAKTEDDLRSAIRAGMTIHLDSLEEMRRVGALAQTVKRPVRVGFRINPDLRGYLEGPADFFIDKFGIPLREVEAAYRSLRRHRWLRPEVVSAHIGSQLSSPRPYRQLIERLVPLVKRLQVAGFPINEINVGGGFPASGLRKATTLRLIARTLGVNFTSPPPPTEVFGQAISRAWRQHASRLSLPVRLALQPGRSLTSSMGLLLMRVTSRKANWLILDGSTYSVPESLYFAERRLVAISQRPGERRFQVSGASASTADVFGLNLRLPELEPGDLVALSDAGAYSISRATQFTVLSPPVYWLTQAGELRLIRRKGRYADVVTPIITK